jgi:hypothetical protein
VLYYERERVIDRDSYREAHVSQLFDETAHDPGVIWLAAHLLQHTHTQLINMIAF